MGDISWWEAFDSHLEAAVIEEMTASGDYDDLHVEEVIVGESINVDRTPLPAVLIQCNANEGEAATHFDGEPHAEHTYPYLLVAYVTAGDYRTVRRDAQEMMGRLRRIALRSSLYSVTGWDGEKTTDVALGREFLEARGRQGTAEGRAWGIAALELKVTTEF